MDRRKIYTVILLLITVLMFGIQVRMSSAAKPGTVLYVADNQSALFYENLFVSIGHLSKGDKVKLLFDPGHEESIDDFGKPLKIETPHRRVEVHVLTGVHEGKSGWVSLINLSKSPF